METLRIRHVITPRFCKLPRKCLLPAGIKLVFFLSSHLRLWYWIVIEFLGGTVSWKVNSRLIEKLLVALDSGFFFFFAMDSNGVERIVIAVQCFFISAWCEFKQTRTNGRSNFTMIVWGWVDVRALGCPVWVSGVVVVWCVVSGCGDDGETVTRRTPCRFKTFSFVHFIRPRMCRHTWTISKVNTEALTCTSHTHVQSCSNFLHPQ